MSLAGAGEGEIDSGSVDQRKRDAEVRDRMARALTCRFGGD